MGNIFPPFFSFFKKFMELGLRGLLVAIYGVCNHRSKILHFSFPLKESTSKASANLFLLKNIFLRNFKILEINLGLRGFWPDLRFCIAVSHICIFFLFKNRSILIMHQSFSKPTSPLLERQISKNKNGAKYLLASASFTYP